MDYGALQKELIRDEGERLKPYRDTVGLITIGVGRNLDGKGITHKEAMMLLQNDIAECEAQLDKYLSWWRSLSDVRQRVLLNMCFNLGIQGLAGFRNTLPLIRDGHYEEAATAMLASKWSAQVGDRAVRLSKMMKEG